MIDADGRNRKQLTDQPPGINCDEPAWSPDGTRILFASNRPGSDGIGNWIMDADGSNQRVLITNTHVRGRPSWCWSPDGDEGESKLRRRTNPGISGDP